jgi:hypothetical protein
MFIEKETFLVKSIPSKFVKGKFVTVLMLSRLPLLGLFQF